MRIIAGQRRGHKFDGPRDQVTRPTSDLVRESVFNILGEAVEGLLVVDLFAGTGALGLEAMSHGLPIVATETGGTSETIRDGQNGFLAKIGDSRTIGKALALLVDDPGLRARMGAESRRAVAHFTLERMLDQTLSLYRSLPRTQGFPAVQSTIKELNKGVRG